MQFILVRWRALLAALAVGLVTSCASGQGGPVGAPVADPDGAAAELVAATQPESPLQVNFAWTLDEAGSRLRGRGVARLEAPEWIRLDLFGPRGETYLAASLVGEDFHFPPGATTGPVALPSSALLWSAVGVVRPPAGARLESATTSADQVTLRYRVEGGETIEYVASVEPMRLLRVSRSGPGAQRETLVLSYAGDGTLESTRYRDVTAYRELVLGIEAMNAVSSFPSTIWRPDVASR